MNSNVKIQKCISAFAGALGMLFCGVIYGWNIFAIALKNKFNSTQTDVENIAISGTLGIYLGSFPAGILFDRFGPRVVSISALVLTGSGYTLMWMTTKFKEYFASNIWLMCIIYFVAMLGNSFTCMASLATNSINFTGKHRGKVVGLASAIFGFSPAIFSLIYDEYFVQGHMMDEENQKLPEYMIFLAACSVIVNLLGVGGLKIVSSETRPVSEETELNDFPGINANVIGKENTTASKRNKRRKENKDMNDETPLVPIDSPNKQDLQAQQVIKTLRFHLLFWIVIFIVGIGGSFINNITSIVKSAYLEEKASLFTIVIPICSSVSRLLSGILPDFLIRKFKDFPISSILLLPTFFTFVFQTLLIFYNQNFLSLFSVAMAMSAVFGAFFVLMPIVIIELFGGKYFGQNLGLCNIASGVGTFGFQMLYGVLYVSNSLPGSIECYGILCHRWYFTVSAILSLVATCLNVLLMYIERFHQS